MNISNRLAGEYRLVVNEGTWMERDFGWFPNLILNQGLDSIGGANTHGSLSHCRIGTGTSAPAATQSALEAQVASAGNNGASYVNEGSPNYGAFLTRQYAFAQGAVVGNMAEIGVGGNSTGATLFSRARIVDGSGNPTVITLTSIDQLTVYYRLRWLPPLVDATGNLTLSGVDYPYTLRAANVNAWGGGGASFLLPDDAMRCINGTAYPSSSTLGALTGTPSGSGTTLGSSHTPSSYTAGTYTRTTTISASTSTANTAGGIGAMMFEFVAKYFQVKFTTPIPKDNTKTLSFPITISWARV